MPLRIYKLSPGEEVSYDLRPVGPPNVSAEPLFVRVERPREGASVELRLTLSDATDLPLASGRVPLERGYMAVVQELRRELEGSDRWPPGLEFELVAREGAVSKAPEAARADMR